MANEERRPTPEEMLARAKAEEERRRRGKLKIFFGASPGVGKTFAMLEAARTKRKEGLDVVIGWIETHGRKETEALTEGLERIPPREIEYRGVRLKEFDLDAALKRRPALLLVDELPHTNAPSSKHARRWQDILEILDAGIDVYSTLNVQHLDSLNDVVAQITHVAVRETVPDSIFERADEVELVDLTPDDLLQRLKEGKVYIPEQAQRAIESFFHKGNLIALRELSLQRTAERVDVQMTTWRREQGIAVPWTARERVLVAIGPAPQSADLVRAACRMATRLGAPWIALSVETPEFHRLPAEERDRAQAHLAMAERLGAEPLVITADNVAETILTTARQRNVSRIVVGKPTHSRWRDRLRGSLVDKLVRGSGPIDVLVTKGELEQAERPLRPEPRLPAPLREYAIALGVVFLSTALSWIGRGFFDLADEAMIYLLGVLFVASRFSRGPAILASLLSVAALDFFFVPPFFTFTVADVRYVVTFAVLLVAGLLVSGLTLRIREQAEAARQRERRTAVLYMMTRSFAARSGVADIAEAAARHVEVLFETEAAVLLSGDQGALLHRGGSAGELVQSEKERTVARWVYEHGRQAGFGTDTLPVAKGLFLPLTGGKGTFGVLGVSLGDRAQPLTPSQRQLLDVFVNQTSLALERAMLTEQAQKDKVTVENERLRSTLLSAVSHDLRTPLAAITGAATSLQQERSNLGTEGRRELLDTIREEAEHLNRIVSDLLDLTRLEAGAVAAKKEWYPLEEVVGSALARLETALAGRDLWVDLPSSLLLVPLDPVLVEQAFINLLENALKYTPKGSPIEVTARLSDGKAQIEISDRGPGIPPGEEKKIFEKLYRVAGTGAPSGTGLGLAICHAIAAAHGGQIEARNREGGGATFLLTLPIEGTPPEMPRDEKP
ncbi:MAG: sensor histidine kinase KdpD [Bdellovibrionota bacterium]